MYEHIHVKWVSGNVRLTLHSAGTDTAAVAPARCGAAVGGRARGSASSAEAHIPTCFTSYYFITHTLIVAHTSSHRSITSFAIDELIYNQFHTHFKQKVHLIEFSAILHIFAYSFNCFKITLNCLNITKLSCFYILSSHRCILVIFNLYASQFTYRSMER